MSNQLEWIEYYTWWGEKVMFCMNALGDMKTYYPERGQDQRWAISEDNPKLDSIIIADVSYPIVSE